MIKRSSGMVRPAASDSIASRSAGRLKKPPCGTPLMKNIGVRFTPLRRQPRVRVPVGTREITVDDAEAVPEPPVELLDDGVGRATMRAGVIAVLHERDRRGGGTADVVARAHRHGE